jgi:hypothetical protein
MEKEGLVKKRQEVKESTQYYRHPRNRESRFI